MSEIPSDKKMSREEVQQAVINYMNASHGQKDIGDF